MLPFGKDRNGFKPYMLSMSNEIFFTNREPYFERNRFQLAFNYRISKVTTVQAGYLHQFEWGCDTGVHTAWAIVEAVDIEHAKQIVPWMFRDKSRVVKVVKYDIAGKIHEV